MKGFLSAFLVFIFWISGGIYYISKTNPLLAEVKSDTNAIEAVSPIPVASLIPEVPKDTAAPTIAEGIDTETADLSTDSLFTDNPSSTSNSQLLADELRKSITISDTIDINEGEPEISFEEEIIEEEKVVTSQLFYPRYTKSSELILDKKLVEYASQLKKILKEFPDKKVTIIGHTDNIGNSKDNFDIGLKKSRQVKWYLTARKGIKRSAITATSKGEQEPVESNNSKWGRKINNRIEIIVE